ncbi:MAG: class II aldolase/adducin family protein [Dissulfurispiraceae bacterium]
MEKLIHKYVDKLEAQGLATKNNIVFLALDAELFSNAPIDGDIMNLRKIFDLIEGNSLLFAEPTEPYRSIIREIVLGSPEIFTREFNFCDASKIIPPDCETRTFFHDIPLVDDTFPESMAKALSSRKSAIVGDRWVVTHGLITPEQAFISFSSVCFAIFVKYFYDSLMYLEKCCLGKKSPDKDFLQKFNKISSYVMDDGGAVQSARETQHTLTQGPPRKEEEVFTMIVQAGRAVVDHHLVDSHFGNISYTHCDTMYISQTGSSMDELENHIDAVPLDNSSSIGITASSELSAHREIYDETGHHAILHGHPKFAVVMSMHCLKEGCDRSACHRLCREKRHVCEIPVVSGEIGTGPTGLMHTVPTAMKEGRGVIVCGHGVFTSGNDDFRQPFAMLSDIEKKCRDQFFRTVRKYGGLLK